MKNNILKYLLLSCTVLAFFSACRKDAYETDGSAGKGASFVRFQEAPVRKLYFDPFTDIKEVTLFNVRRDANTQAELNKAVTVTLTPVALTEVDAEEYAGYETLPTSIFSLNNSALTAGSGGSITVAFAAGVDVQNFAVKLNGSKFDLSKKYALAYEISDASGLTHKVGKDTIVAVVGIKNYLEGTYQATGIFHHPTGGDRPYDFEKYLSTSGANSVTAPVGDLTPNVFDIIVDPVTNKVTFNGSISPTQPIVPSPGEVNEYDPATQTLTLHYQYDGAGGARKVEEVLVFKSR